MANHHTLLVEIGTEELPPRHLDKLSEAFALKIAALLSEQGFDCQEVEHFVSPRRIAARLLKIPAHSPARLTQRKGPAKASAFTPDGTPTPAALGFAKSCHIPVENLKIIETPQGEWLVCEQEEPGKSLQTLLPSIIEEGLKAIPATKRMRWGSGSLEFLRPIHWIACLHGDQTLNMQVFGMNASNLTCGHRFHFPHPTPLHNADDYVEELRELKVMVDQHERKQTIEQAVQKLAKQHGGMAILDPELLDQVTGLVEWPVPLYAHFDKSFLEVPQEALISSMQNHQKCFPIQNTLGKLLPTFILISNTDANPPTNIIQGNERVMQARLADAKFFYDKDRKTPLNSRLEPLKNMIFQKKLGTLYDKAQRVAKLSGHIAKLINAPVRTCERAAKLCKADLLTEMVFEFPELQGIMGNYYARHDGEPDEVAKAIQESYLPRFAKDDLPESLPGIAIALADRLDTLVGIFGIGQIPTGDKDPYALRRQALAIDRILIEKALPLDLNDLCETARRGYGNLFDEDIVPKVVTFCCERFKAWGQEQGATLQIIDAVMANHITEPYDCSLRVMAVTHFQTLPEAEKLASANKRARNILQKSGLMINPQQLLPIDPALLKDPAEIALFEALQTLQKATDPLIENRQYQEALILLATLQQPVDNFFESVMVMTDDEALRKNRVYLLCHLCALFGKIADISRLVI
jgi:glycyl-tRNA synthetase beta chain